MKEQTVSTNYKGTDITYNEHENRWEFTLRNKDRHAGTLTLAKEAIDKPVPADKKPFKRFDVYIQDGWGSAPKKATVTSLAAEGRYTRREAWVNTTEKNNRRVCGTTGITDKRQKVLLDNMYLFNDHNTKLVEQIAANNKEAQRLSDLNAKLMGALTHASIKPEDYD